MTEDMTLFGDGAWWSPRCKVVGCDEPRSGARWCRRHDPGAKVLPDPTRNTRGQSHRDAGDTEAGAADAVWPRTGTQRETVLLCLRDGSGTDDEIAQRTGLYRYSAAPRRYELVKMGWAVDTGERRASPRSMNGEIVWGLSDAARDEFARRSA